MKLDITGTPNFHSEAIDIKYQNSPNSLIDQDSLSSSSLASFEMISDKVPIKDNEDSGEAAFSRDILNTGKKFKLSASFGDIKQKLKNLTGPKSYDESKPRVIHINDSSSNLQQKFVHNGISTAKYHVYSFLPKFLYEQFSKYANIFFLFTSCIQV